MPNAYSLPASIAVCSATTMSSIGNMAGLLETLAALKRLRIKSAGAGRDQAQARAPAILRIQGKGRVIVFSFASITAGYRAIGRRCLQLLA